MKIQINKVVDNGKVYYAAPPLIFCDDFTQPGSEVLWRLENYRGLLTFYVAEDLEDLIFAVIDEIGFLINEYAESDDSELTEKAQELKQQVKKHFKRRIKS